MNRWRRSGSERAIQLWVETQAFRLIVAGHTLRDAADEIGKMGRGEMPGRLAGVNYPANYHPNNMTVLRAFRRYCQKNPVAEADEMRRVDTQRCDDIIRGLWPAVVKGNPKAGHAVISALRHRARLNGLEMPIKIAPTDARGRDRIPIEAVWRLMEGDGEVVAIDAPRERGNGRGS